MALPPHSPPPPDELRYMWGSTEGWKKTSQEDRGECRNTGGNENERGKRRKSTVGGWLEFTRATTGGWLSWTG